MRVRWFGQSAFLLVGQKTVFVDPFGDMSGAAARGIEFNYPPIEGVTADLVLVTHEHGDTTASMSSAAHRSSCARPQGDWTRR